jgi:hypothetical protein
MHAKKSFNGDDHEIIEESTTRSMGLCVALIDTAGGDVGCYGPTILLAGGKMPFRS